MKKMSLSFPRMRESISSSGVFPLQALIPAFARMTKLEYFIFCHVQRNEAKNCFFSPFFKVSCRGLFAG